MASPRPTERSFFLSTRVGRRMFALFVGCALVPIALVAVLSWSRVGQQLEWQSQIRLHQAARAAGMRIAEKLGDLEYELRTVRVSAGGGSLPDRLRPHALGVLLPSGEVRALYGQPPPRFELTAADRERIESGHGVLRVSREGTAARFDLAAAGEAGSVLVVRIAPLVLFDFSEENVLPHGAELCVLERDGAELFCSFEGAPPPPPPKTRSGSPELVPWKLGDEDHLALHWLLFLRSNWGSEGWDIVVAEPRDVAFGPAATFRRVLILVAALSVFMVALLTAVRIRRRLEPLRELVGATGRLAGGDFSVRTDLGGDDEFGELASSFAVMATQLQGQFAAMERLVEIDRTILSCRSEESLVASALEAAAELYPAECVAMILSGADSLDQRVLWVRHEGDGRIERSAAAPWTPEELESLERAPSFGLTPVARLTSALREAWTGSFASAAVLPLRSGASLTGTVLVPLPKVSALDTGPILRLRQLCDQLASALHGLRLRAENERLRYFDPLTGLANDRAHRERLEAALRDARGSEDLVVVAHVAIRGIERVLAAFGADEVDRVLRRVAEVLASIEDAKAAHLSTGEFGLLASGADREAVASRVQGLHGVVQAALVEDERSHALVLAVGAAVHPLDGSEPAELLANAEAAERHVVEGFGAAPVFFSREMTSTVRARMRLEEDLARAIERDELRLFHQPIADADGDIVAAEALLRWQHPDRGEVRPDEFITVAEESGLIEPIGRWALRRACEDARSWLDRGLPPIRVSVNAAAQQFRSGRLFSEVQSALGASALPPGALTLELTESALLGNEIAAIETIASIRRLGVSISIDDFGTGYSSLSYLKRFRVDAVKIDRSFLQGVPVQSDDCALVEAIIAMAHSLGLGVIAEGCETEAQRAFLLERGCDLIQGYLLSPPLPEDAFRKLLEERWPA